MAWDDLDLASEIESEFSGFGTWYVSESGASLRVVDFLEAPPRRPVGRPPTMLAARGVRKTVMEWATDLGCDTRVIFGRLARGWSVEDAVTKPVSAMGRVGKNRDGVTTVLVGSVRKTVCEWAQILGCAPRIIQQRLDRGWIPAIAVTTPVTRSHSCRVRRVVRPSRLEIPANDVTAPEQLAMPI